MGCDAPARSGVSSHFKAGRYAAYLKAGEVPTAGHNWEVAMTSLARSLLHRSGSGRALESTQERTYHLEAAALATE